MQLNTALLEFFYSKDHSPASQRWYRSRLGAFTTWLLGQGTDTLEDITAPQIRRYLDERRTTISPHTGKPIDSHTLHGHTRAIKTLLNWAASEGLVDERLTRRITLPKKAEKLLPILTPDQIRRLHLACGDNLRDRAILAVLLDTGIRPSELCGVTLDRVHLIQDDAYLRVLGKGRKVREVGLGQLSQLSDDIPCHGRTPCRCRGADARSEDEPAPTTPHLRPGDWPHPAATDHVSTVAHRLKYQVHATLGQTAPQPLPTQRGTCHALFSPPAPAHACSRPLGGAVPARVNRAGRGGVPYTVIAFPSLASDHLHHRAESQRTWLFLLHRWANL